MTNVEQLKSLSLFSTPYDPERLRILITDGPFYCEGECEATAKENREMFEKQIIESGVSLVIS